MTKQLNISKSRQLELKNIIETQTIKYKINYKKVSKLKIQKKYEQLLLEINFFKKIYKNIPIFF
jgi:hypothetical protein